MRQFIVMCPDCHYKILVNSDEDARYSELEAELAEAKAFAATLSDALDKANEEIKSLKARVEHWQEEASFERQQRKYGD